MGAVWHLPGLFPLLQVLLTGISSRALQFPEPLQRLVLVSLPMLWFQLQGLEHCVELRK